MRYLLYHRYLTLANLSPQTLYRLSSGDTHVLSTEAKIRKQRIAGQFRNGGIPRRGSSDLVIMMAQGNLKDVVRIGNSSGA